MSKILTVAVALALASGAASAAEIKRADGSVRGGVDGSGNIEDALPPMLQRNPNALEIKIKPDVPLGPRSLLQACRKEIPALCPEKKSIIGCLTSQVDAIKDPKCKSWIVSRDVCSKASAATGKCTKGDTPRHCLRKIPTNELPEECTVSEFYKSVKMSAATRRKLKKKEGVLGKPESDDNYAAAAAARRGMKAQGDDNNDENNSEEEQQQVHESAVGSGVLGVGRAARPTGLAARRLQQPQHPNKK